MGLATRHVRQQVLTGAIVNLIAETGLPFQLVETRGFECFMKVVDNRFRGVSQRIVTRNLVGLLDEIKHALKEQIHDAMSAGSNIHATIDLWSSHANEPMINERFHFFDKNFVCQIKTAAY